MKYTFFALGHIAALAAAAADSCKTKGTWDLCKPLTWEPQHPTNASAVVSTVADCLNVCDMMNSGSGWETALGRGWPVRLHDAPVGQKLAIAHSGSCQISLGRASADSNIGPFFFITQNDIFNIIDNVIAKFGSTGQVAATGNVSWWGDNVTWWVDSGIGSVPYS
ncbi:hypothetical protein BJ166DRAFT_588687 [Pestalotiopsis sp. NC0098]|nr:hypothetical protein BJ166DRAFT_588687 [Pestalotiopsis sp. NC0098]